MFLWSRLHDSAKDRGPDPSAAHSAAAASSHCFYLCIPAKAFVSYNDGGLGRSPVTRRLASVDRLCDTILMASVDLR